MAGSSKAFEEAGYLFPKNLIEINEKALLQHVIENLQSIENRNLNFTNIIQQSENARYHTGASIKLIEPKSEIVELNRGTSGAACSALMAIDHINNSYPLLIANGDQILSTNLTSIIDDFEKRDLDGGIAVFKDIHPRWSFVKCDASGQVIEAAEKRPISNLATAGIYYFKQGKDFVESAMTMIQKDAHVNGLFYVCPSYNEMILQHKKIGIYEIPKKSYHSLATPRGVNHYETLLSRGQNSITEFAL